MSHDEYCQSVCGFVMFGRIVVSTLRCEDNVTFRSCKHKNLARGLEFEYISINIIENLLGTVA